MSSSPTKWEHRTELLHQAEASMARLNALGADGWEVCFALPIPERTGWYQWLFKRPLATKVPVLETKDVPAVHAGKDAKAGG